MSNIEKIKFPALDMTGANYIHGRKMLKGISNQWVLLQHYKRATNAKGKSNILWKDLQSKFNHQREVLLPSTRDEWNNLRFQDFKKVNEYTSALFRICQTLRFCGQTVTEGDLLDKTFSTFHALNINLQQQYRLQNFKRYPDLHVNLLVAEKNNELLMKNHQTRPTGSLALPEENDVNNNDNKNSRSKRGRGNPHGCGRGHGLYGHNRFLN
ncbi:hypothetical protein Tco_0725340 [Tanacetum coccineum]|uniref:Retrotransposon gag domain-containing protein n=1 Tax=Tanacetum coccineum TaxID=301880 RepID=A0ABQ4YCM0_9ASTR